MANNVLNDPVVQPAADPPHKRDDVDNESLLQAATRKAASMGMQVMVKNGKIVMFKETDLESKPATMTFTDGVTPIISGTFKTTNQGKFASCKVQHHDPKTGKLTTATFNDPNPIAGTKAVLNIREKPDYEGSNDDPDPDPTVAIGKGAPGSEGLSIAQLAATGLSKITSVIGGIEANISGAEATVAKVETTLGHLI